MLPNYRRAAATEEALDSLARIKAALEAGPIHRRPTDARLARAYEALRDALLQAENAAETMRHC